MNQGERDQLIAGAKLGMQNAYAIVSSFPVGAAVLTATGKVFQGCNTESVISGMGICSLWDVSPVHR